MGPQCSYYRSQFRLASIFSVEKTPGFRKIYLSYLIANIVINVKTANIVINVIIAIIVKTANIVITGRTAISRTGLIPPDLLSVVAVISWLIHRKPGGDYQTPHKPQTFPILTSPFRGGIRSNSARPRPRPAWAGYRSSRRKSVCAACRLSDVGYS